MFSTADLPATMRPDATRPHVCGQSDCTFVTPAPITSEQTGVASHG